MAEAVASAAGVVRKGQGWFITAEKMDCHEKRNRRGGH